MENLKQQIIVSAHQLALAFSEDNEKPQKYKAKHVHHRERRRYVKYKTQNDIIFEENVSQWKQLIEIMLERIEKKLVFRIINLNPNVDLYDDCFTEVKDFITFTDYFILRRNVEICDSEELGRLAVLHTAFHNNIDVIIKTRKERQFVDYTKNTELILINTEIPENEIFNIAGVPNQGLYLSIFEFYYKSLIIIEKQYSLNPCGFYFTEFTDLNAFAMNDNFYNVIGFNKGLIFKIEEKLRNRLNLFDKGINLGFIDFENQLDTTISELMFQTALHFTFYHEVAHVIQGSDYLNQRLNEQFVSASSFDLYKHVIELDADEFSALRIGDHVIQYMSNISKDELTNGFIENLLIITSSSILSYLLIFKSNYQEFYLKAYSHPHPTIRILAILLHMMNYVIEYLKTKAIYLDFQLNELVKKSFEFSKNIENDELMMTFLTQILIKQTEIKEYMKEIDYIKANDKSMATYKSNLIG